MVDFSTPTYQSGWIGEV